MTYVLIAAFTGLLLLGVGTFQTGITVGEARLRRLELQAQRQAQEAMARSQRRALPRAGYLYVEPWPTVPNVIYSDWRAEIDGTEREIRQLTQRAAEVIPPRYR